MHFARPALLTALGHLPHLGAPSGSLTLLGMYHVTSLKDSPPLQEYCAPGVGLDEDNLRRLTAEDWVPFCASCHYDVAVALVHDSGPRSMNAQGGVNANMAHLRRLLQDVTEACVTVRSHCHRCHTSSCCRDVPTAEVAVACTSRWMGKTAHACYVGFSVQRMLTRYLSWCSPACCQMSAQ